MFLLSHSSVLTSSVPSSSINYTGYNFCILRMVARVPDWWPQWVSVCTLDCVWLYAWLFMFTFIFSYSAAKVCMSSEETFFAVLTYERPPSWREQKKGLVAGLKKKKNRHAWQQQYKYTSYLTCSSGRVWYDKNHHIGWEARQPVGRHAQTQHNPNSYHYSWHTLCWKEATPAPNIIVSITQNQIWTWYIIQFT